MPGDVTENAKGKVVHRYNASHHRIFFSSLNLYSAAHTRWYRGGHILQLSWVVFRRCGDHLAIGVIANLEAYLQITGGAMNPGKPSPHTRLG